MKRFLALVLCAALILCTFTVLSGATAMYLFPASVGNHSSYGGGSSSYGGGGSGDGLFGLFGLFGMAGRSPTGFVVIVIILVVLYFYNKGKRTNRGAGSGTGSVVNTAIPLRNANLAIVESITEHDPGFSEEKFLTYAEKVFVQIQQAWTERDWSKVRAFESDALFNLHKSQLDEYIRNGTINVMERVCVNQSYLCDYSQEEKYEYLTVFMQTSYVDYIIREDTKQVVTGDPNHTFYTDYKLKFMRSMGVLTSETNSAVAVKCPNCGAPVDVNAAGQCSYCGTVITGGEHSWVLCDLDDIR